MSDLREVRLKAARYLSRKIKPSDRPLFLDAIAKEGLSDWANEHHFDAGMTVRNLLRTEGYSEEALGIFNLDDVWAELFLEALNFAPS